jgi:hypothetical protein
VPIQIDESFAHLAAMDGDFARRAGPPEMAEKNEGGDPEIFDGQEAKCLG